LPNVSVATQASETHADVLRHVYVPLRFQVEYQRDVKDRRKKSGGGTGTTSHVFPALGSSRASVALLCGTGLATSIANGCVRCPHLFPLLFRDHRHRVFWDADLGAEDGGNSHLLAPPTLWRHFAHWLHSRCHHLGSATPTRAAVFLAGQSDFDTLADKITATPDRRPSG